MERRVSAKYVMHAQKFPLDTEWTWTIGCFERYADGISVYTPLVDGSYGKMLWTLQLLLDKVKYK